MISGDESAAAESLITEREAFAAMWFFAKRFVDEAGNDLATFLGDTKLQPDGMPFDPAAWNDWLESVRMARRGDPQV